MNSAARWVAALSAVATAFAWPSAASTQDSDDPIERAHAAYAEGDFEAAVAAYEAGLSADDGLDTERLARLLSGLALVRHALGEAEAARDALALLVATTPDAALDARAPPSLRQVLESVRAAAAPLRLVVDERVQTGALSGMVVVRARVENDPGLVRAIRVVVRDRGGWDADRDAERTLPAGAAYYVEAVGPGGTVVARAGSANAPRRAPRLAAGPSSEGGTVAPASDGADSANTSRAWKWVLGIGAALVAGAVALGVWAATRDRGIRTMIGPPMEL